MRTLIVHSYKGGSGKTLISTNMAKILANMGKRVLIIETDFSMPSFEEIYSEHSPDIFLNDYLNNSKINIQKCIYPDSNTDLGLIYAQKQFKAADKVHSSDLSWFNEQRERMRKDLGTLDYDYVIFDSAPGIHFFTINALSIASDIFLVIRPDSHSLKGSQHMLDQVYKRAARMKTTNTILIFNQIPDYDKMKNEVEIWKTRFIGRNDFIKNVIELPYEAQTAYHSAIEKIRLPFDDPTSSRLKKMINEILNL